MTIYCHCNYRMTGETAMKIIILGAGQAGFMTAKTLRDNDPDIQIQIFDLDTAGLYAAP